MEPTETPPPESPRGRRRLNSTIVAAGAAVALTLSGLGLAGAQTGSSTTTPDPGVSTEASKPADAQGRQSRSKGHHPGGHRGLTTAARTIGISDADLMAALRSGQSIADVARSKNVDVQKVIDAMVAERRKILAEKVAAGKLTQAQADDRSAGLTRRITSFVNHDGHRPGRPKGSGGRHRRGVKGTLAVAAKTIGVSERHLMTALRSGQSIADVARSKNVDVQKVIDAMVAEAEKILAEKVAAAQLTEAQAGEKSAHLAERITALVNQAGPRRGGHRLGRPKGAEGAQQAPDGERRRGIAGPALADTHPRRHPGPPMPEVDAREPLSDT